MAVVVDVPCNWVEFLQLLCSTRSLSRRQSGIEREIVLLLNVIKHSLTTRCYNTHGSDLNLCFHEVFTRSIWKGRIGQPWM
jgi:hypothetical protein